MERIKAEQPRDILDLVMPHQDGYEINSFMQTRNTHIPVSCSPITTRTSSADGRTLGSKRVPRKAAIRVHLIAERAGDNFRSRRKTTSTTQLDEVLRKVVTNRSHEEQPVGKGKQVAAEGDHPVKS